MKIKKTICLLTFFILILACKDKDSPNPVDDLPPETQTGQQTFGCIVNGRAWVPSVPFPLNRLTVDYYHGTIAIKARLKKDGRDQLIYLSRDSLVTNGNYFLYDGLYKQAQLYDFNSNCTFQTDSQNIGELEMTRVDTINMIFSGRFHFKIGVAGCDTIRVTDGRFDLRL